MIELLDVTRRFGDTTAVGGVTLELPAGSIGVLFGPSGCGKSTLLRIIAGLERADAGRVRIAGREVDGGGGFVAPERRNVGMVFQDLALFPHLTVRRNVRFGIRARPGADARVRSMLELARLGPLADRLPHQLSGGEQQRVALARALAPEPDVLLLDEPFASLDAGLRGEVRDELLGILRTVGTTVLMVTHDREEALGAAEQLMVMNHGRLVQSGSPESLYGTPRTRDVARLLGEGTFLPGNVREGRVHCALGGFPVDGRPEGPCEVFVRSESVRLSEHGPLEATVEGGAYHGHDCLVRLRLADGAVVQSRQPHGRLPAPGSRVTIVVDDGVRVFDHRAIEG
ncbi:MAG: ABC transporter ATP-binding protein [Planctomycetota bacterium]|nr:ABC transporter ATP-binding protein [Planctomycetota bacterium]